MPANQLSSYSAWQQARSANQSAVFNMVCQMAEYGQAVASAMLLCSVQGYRNTDVQTARHVTSTYSPCQACPPQTL